jgi:hypothetical protein
MDSWFLFFLASLVPLLPILVLDIVAMILALARWKRHPRVSIFTFTAFAILFVAAIVGKLVLAWLPAFLLDQLDWKLEQVLPIYTIIGGISVLVETAALILLLFAIFGDRTPGKSGLRHPQNERD